MSRVNHPTRQTQLGHKHLVWVDLIKAIAIIWILLNHTSERLLGFPYIANPSAGWPLLGERLAQLRPLEGFALWGIPLNLLRYVGWAGDQAVQLFLIISGFGLTWGLLNRYGGGPLPIFGFYRRRAGRVYPLWWGAHLFFMVLWLLTSWGLSMAEPATYLSMMGIRLTPELFYYFAPAWWYIGLLLQLYLLYPLLWEGLQRLGPLWLLLVGCAVGFAARAVGLVLFEGYLDAWLRGAVFITRLPEFLFGISLAAWLYHAPVETDARLRAPKTLLLAVMCYAVGTVLALTLPGMTIAPFLLGVGIFLLLYAVLARIGQVWAPGTRLGMWVGRHSYSLYLMHHPLILLLVPVGLAASSQRLLVSVAGAAILTVVLAIALEWAVDGTLALLRRCRTRSAIIRTVLSVAAVGVVVGVLLVGSELLIRWQAPQEVLGWGERSSLEPDPEFGWRLRPSQTTRLRWESYDYEVTANSLGFPGPEYPLGKEPGTFRILTVGDAFTSAEGVDTDEAWPRLLEAELSGQMPGQEVEVLNFGISGYGPNQYAALVEKFAPLYQPDLILIGFFVNEYQDVLRSYDEVRREIGFELPSQDGWYAIARLEHLRRLRRLQLIEPLLELFRGEPRLHGYFLGNFSALERDTNDLDTARPLVAERLAQIDAAADGAGAKVVVMMIPAPVQVCGPDQLAYYPRNVNLEDSGRYDIEQPQRITQALAERFGFEFYDLRPRLRSTAEGCPYQEHNMHWTSDGHQAVAAFLADVLLEDGCVQ